MKPFYSSQAKFTNILIVIILLLTSCNSTEILHRKYFHGYYIDQSGKGKSNENCLREENPDTKIVCSISNKEIFLSDIKKFVNETVGEKTNNVIRQEIFESELAEKKLKFQRNKSLENNSKTQETKTSYKYDKNLLLKKAKPRSNEYLLYDVYDEDTMNILILILCLLVPPMAIYLKSKKINNWFWITLIFCLLSTGVFLGFAPLGTGWFIAFIIALLYVLEILK